MKRARSVNFERFRLLAPIDTQLRCRFLRKYTVPKRVRASLNIASPTVSHLQHPAIGLFLRLLMRTEITRRSAQRHGRGRATARSEIVKMFRKTAVEITQKIPCLPRAATNHTHCGKEDAMEQEGRAMEDHVMEEEPSPSEHCACEPPCPLSPEILAVMQDLPLCYQQRKQGAIAPKTIQG